MVSTEKIDKFIELFKDVAIENANMIAHFYKEGLKDTAKDFENNEIECLELIELLRELKAYREQVQNLIENKSMEIVNPFNTYDYMRVVRVADLYDLMEVKNG